MNQSEASKKFEPVATELTARAIIGRCLGRKLNTNLLRGVDEDIQDIFMSQAGGTSTSSICNILAMQAAKTTLSNILVAIKPTHTDWVEFRHESAQIFFARPGRADSVRKIDKRIHNTLFQSNSKEDQPSLFDLDPDITDHRYLAYEEKRLRASKDTIFCQLLIETGHNGLVVKAVFSALTVVHDEPLFTFEVNLVLAEAIANRLIEEEAPELEFLLTMVGNSANAIIPIVPAYPAPIPSEEVRREVDTTAKPAPAPIPDEAENTQQQA